MEWYQILSLVVSAVVSILTLLGFGTVTKFYWEDKHKKKLEETEEVKKRKKEERHKEITDAVSEIFDPYSDKVVGAINKIEERLDLAKRCDLAELRNSLMNIYYNCALRGYRTEDDSKNYREMHEVYSALGGNSFIDNDVSRWFDDLPLKPNDYYIQKAKKKSAESKSTIKKAQPNTKEGEVDEQY